MSKNISYFVLKTLFVLEIFTFLSLPFGYVEQRLDKEGMLDFKTYNVTNWPTLNYNTHIK